MQCDIEFIADLIPQRIVCQSLFDMITAHTVWRCFAFVVACIIILHGFDQFGTVQLQHTREIVRGVENRSNEPLRFIILLKTESQVPQRHLQKFCGFYAVKWLDC